MVAVIIILLLLTLVLIVASGVMTVRCLNDYLENPSWKFSLVFAFIFGFHCVCGVLLLIYILGGF